MVITVRKLIEKLQTMKQDAEINVMDSDGNHLWLTAEAIFYAGHESHDGRERAGLVVLLHDSIPHETILAATERINEDGEAIETVIQEHESMMRGA